MLKKLQILSVVAISFNPFYVTAQTCMEKCAVDKQHCEQPCTGSSSYWDCASKCNAASSACQNKCTCIGKCSSDEKKCEQSCKGSEDKEECIKKCTETATQCLNRC